MRMKLIRLMNRSSKNEEDEVSKARARMLNDVEVDKEDWVLEARLGARARMVPHPHPPHQPHPHLPHHPHHLGPSTQP